MLTTTDTTARVQDDQARPPLPSLAQVKAALLASIAGAEPENAPFRHIILNDLLPPPVLSALTALPYQPIELNGVSGRRELQNDQRAFFDTACQARLAVCRLTAQALQSAAVVRAFAEAIGAPLASTHLRIEYARDAAGFWLEPHTDLGVKAFSLLAPLPEGPWQADLGTDLYRGPGQWDRRTPFTAGSALVFVPSDVTWHGFEPRPIVGIRRSLIVNYVTADWRARDQLAFPTRPVRC